MMIIGVCQYTGLDTGPMDSIWIFDKGSSMEIQSNISIYEDSKTSDASYQDTNGDKSIRDWSEFVAAIWLVKYVLFLIILLGTIGNVLSVLVLMRKRMRNNSVNLYLTLLSFADMSVLYLSGFKTWYRVVIGFELLHTSNAGCKIIMFLFSFTSHASAWLIVLVTADRFVAVWFPFKASSLCSVRKSRLAGLLLLLVSALSNLHLIFTVHLYEMKPGVLQCAPLTTNAFMNGPYNYIRLASYALVPFALVLGMNVGIVACICTHSKQFSCPGPEEKKDFSAANQRIKQHKHQVTFMLLVVSFAWIILAMPFAVISLVNFQYPDSHSRAIVFLLKTIAFLLMYLNHAINFTLYCISGRKFRSEFVSMFRELNWSALSCREPPNMWSLVSRMDARRAERRRRRRPQRKHEPVAPGKRIVLNPSLNRFQVI